MNRSDRLNIDTGRFCTILRSWVWLQLFRKENSVENIYIHVNRVYMKVYVSNYFFTLCLVMVTVYIFVFSLCLDYYILKMKFNDKHNYKSEVLINEHRVNNIM
jgi:hypothetical protein